ncbi:GDYXXLXY domain-containing protein [Paenibacillus turpanensis]|uniref:GDYXXLXY domain-containing protein n=1 Tax=Paenibacillus turpanensis TaxID=2689078 RepID=UPI00140C4D4E|nr:GDYXXLXY domain-containing protein [Paenibacillus turpanensis]
MKKNMLYLLILLQTLFLLGMAGTSYATGWLGQEIKLKTVPVDPRDFLYGDYVILQYDASRISPSQWKGSEPYPEAGTVVYSLLREKEGLYELAAVYPQKPEAGAGEVVLKGVVDFSWEERIDIDYGLERYYVPEGTGKELEEKADRLVVTIKVAPWGQAQITGVETIQ